MFLCDAGIGREKSQPLSLPAHPVALRRGKDRLRSPPMKTKPGARTGKKKPAPRRKRETVADYLRSIEPTRQPRPDRDFAAMIMAERARE